MSKPMKAIIMAGGVGSRLRPLTCDRPKPMMPLLGRPMMSYILKRLGRHGFHDVAATLMYMPQAISDYFGDGEDYGLSIRYYLESTPLGTAGSVRSASDFLDTDFLVISGDALTDFDLTALQNFHKERGAAVTIALTRVARPLEYGQVSSDAGGRIKGFLEKPGWEQVFSDYVNTGIYIISREILDLIPQGKPFDFSKDLFPRLLKENYPIYGCPLSGYWCDIGTAEEYRKANYDLLDGIVKNVPPGARQTAPGVWVMPSAQIDEHAAITGPVFIDRGAVIEAGATVDAYSVIGRNSRVCGGAVIKRGILWENVHISSLASVSGAILGRQTRVHSHASLLEGAIIGDGAQVGSFAQIKPGVKIWPHKEIAEQSIVGNNLVWGEKCCGASLSGSKVIGDINGELSPDRVLSLGQAFASFLKQPGGVLIGHDGNTSAALLMNSFGAGLLAGGRQPREVAYAFLPLLRYALRTGAFAGGMYCLLKEKHVEIYFFDSDGLPLLRSDERSLNHIWQSREFPPVLPYEGDMAEPLDLRSDYLLDLQKRADLNSLSLPLELLLPPGHLWETGLLLKERWPSVILSNSSLASNIKTSGVAFTLKAEDSGGELYTIFDEKGQIISPDMFYALQVLLLAGEESEVAAPYCASHSLEGLAESAGGHLRRASSRPALLLRDMLQNGGEKQAQIAFDALGCALILAAHLQKSQVLLSNLCRQIPPLYIQHSNVPCPWQEKATVMRRLQEERDLLRLELNEGVKLYHEKGWVLVLPDANQPFCQICCEARDMETAQELALSYEKKLKEYQQGKH